MRLIGANRVGAMKSATIRYVKFEEPDEYPTLTQGRVTDLVIARTANFGRKAKIYGDGTPTFQDASEIERQVKRGDQRKWHLHCPDCGHAQVLVWDNLKSLDGEPDTARYCCSA
jgi:phage terminase large subunit GpA-like protein